MSNDRAIRKELVNLLGAPSDWRGCYLPFDPDGVKMFQIGVDKPRFVRKRPEASSRLSGVLMLSDNLIKFLPDPDKERLRGYVEETKKHGSDGVHWLSQENDSSGSVKAILSENEVTIEGSKVEMKYLMAKVLRIENITTEKNVEIRKALLQAAPRLRENLDGRPANVYVVVGAYYLNLTATAAQEFAFDVDATVAGNGVGGEAASSRTHKAIATNKIALVRLLQYPTKDLKKKKEGLTVSTDNPGVTDAVAGTGISGTSHESASSTTGRLFADATPHVQYFVSGSQLQSRTEVAGSSIDLDDAVSWTIGEEVPLDDDTDIDSGIYAPNEVYASAETDHDNQLELANADECEEPVVSWTIGEEVPLDDDADIDSGIYAPNEVFTSAETDHQNPLELAREDKMRSISEDSEKPEVSLKIGGQVPLGKTDDINTGINHVSNMEAIREKLSTTGIAVRYQRDNSNQKKGILRLLEPTAAADGPAETLILNQVIEREGRSGTKYLVEVVQSRINLKDVIGAFGSEGSMSGLIQALKEKAIVLLAATRSKRDRRVKLAPLRFTIDDETVSLARVEIMHFLCSQRDITNGALTNILPTEGVAMGDSSITFITENFAEDSIAGSLTNVDLILQVSNQVFDIGKWAGVVVPVFAVFAFVISKIETVQGLKSDFIDLLERWGKVEGNLPDERRLKSDMLGLAEDFFFMSKARIRFASKDFQVNFTRLMGQMDRAVMGATLRQTVETRANVRAVMGATLRQTVETRAKVLETIDTKVDTLLHQTASNADEKKKG